MIWKLIADSLPTWQCGYIVSLLESLKLSTTTASQRKAYETTDKRPCCFMIQMFCTWSLTSLEGNIITQFDSCFPVSENGHVLFYLIHSSLAFCFFLFTQDKNCPTSNFPQDNRVHYECLLN